MEEDEGLQALLQQRLSRPSYKRTISQELSRSATGATCKPQDHIKHGAEPKSKPKNRANVGGGDGSDAEYETAPEEFQSSSGEEELEREELTEDEEYDLLYYFLNNAVTTKRSGQKRKAKMRRKQKRLEGATALEEVVGSVPYVHSVRPEIAITPESLHVPLDKPVASLQECCVAALSQVRLDPDTVPPRMRGMLGNLASIQSHHTLKVRALCHLLTWMEKVYKDANTRHYSCIIKDGLMFRRSVWQVIEARDNPNSNYYHYGQDNRSMLTLPATHAYLTKRPETPANISSLQSHDVFIVLAAAVESLLPPINVEKSFLSKKRMSGSEEERVKAACNAAIVQVKNYLKQKCPHLVEERFDYVVPYAWWARGNLHQAEQAFLNLINSHKISDELTALFINELGRMYVHFGDSAKAATCFTTAQEKASAENDEEEESGIAKTQMRMLVANAFTSGILTDAKAQSAAKAWCRVLHSSHLSDTSQVAALSSWVGVHAGKILEADKTWHESLSEMLSEVLHHSPHRCMVYLPLSLIHAMAGQNAASLHTFLRFVDLFCASSQGEAVNLYREWHPQVVRSRNGQYVPVRTINPWEDIVNYVKLTQQALQPIKILWRTQLCHPVWPEDGVPMLQVTDRGERDAKFWINEDGFLTGQMQMVLPPMSSVQLNPYTGQIIFSKQQSPQRWNDLIRYDLGTFQEHDFLPCETLLYEGSNGARVDLFMARLHPVGNGAYIYGNLSEIQSCLAECHLRMRQPGGSNHKINIKKLLKSESKRLVLEEYEDQYGNAGPEAGDDEYWTCLRHNIEEADRLGLDMDYEAIAKMTKTQRANKQAYAERKARMIANIEETKDCTKKQILQKKFKKFFKDDVKSKTMSGSCRLNYELEDFYTLGDLLIMFWISKKNSCRILMMVDCSSMESFKEPRLYSIPGCEYRNGSRYCGLAVPQADVRHHPHAQFFAVRKKQKSQTMLLYFNTKGELLHEDNRGNEVYQCATGSYMYGTYPAGRQNRLIYGNESCVHVGPNLNEPISRLELLHTYLLVLTETQMYITDSEANPLMWNVDSSRIVFGENLCSVIYQKAPTILASRMVKTSLTNCSGDTCRIILQLEDLKTLFVMEIGKTIDRPRPEVHLLLELTLPIDVREVAFINGGDGFVAAGSLMDPADSSYIEQVFQYSYEGRLLRVLPAVGKGPHHFYSAYLPGDPDLTRGHLPVSAPGWFVFFKDGHGAICCFRADGL